MRVVVAYEMGGAGLPVAVEDTCKAMAQRIGITSAALSRLLNGENYLSKLNAYGIPLELRWVDLTEPDDADEAEF